jgi:hypothetical protein
VIDKAVFNLPDDFKGDIRDAFTELLKYHTSDIAKSKYSNKEELKVNNLYELIDILWNDDNHRLKMLSSLSVWNGKEETWEHPIKIE